MSARGVSVEAKGSRAAKAGREPDELAKLSAGEPLVIAAVALAMGHAHNGGVGAPLKKSDFAVRLEEMA
jgi:hypothetical protein